MMPENPTAKAIFLDRDGVLVVPEFRDGRSFAPRKLSDFRLYDDAAESLSALKAAGFLLIVVTNQPDVGAGIVARDVVEQMHQCMLDALPIDDIGVCFHTRLDHCDCRKPKPGMILDAAARLSIDLTRSYMVGDRASDVHAGADAGCQTVFIDLGYTAEAQPDHPTAIVGSLREATDWILANEQRVRR